MEQNICKVKVLYKCNTVNNELFGLTLPSIEILLVEIIA